MAKPKDEVLEEVRVEDLGQDELAQPKDETLNKEPKAPKEPKSFPLKRGPGRPKGSTNRVKGVD